MLLSPWRSDQRVPTSNLNHQQNTWSLGLRLVWHGTGHQRGVGSGLGHGLVASELTVTLRDHSPGTLEVGCGVGLGGGVRPPDPIARSRDISQRITGPARTPSHPIRLRLLRLAAAPHVRRTRQA